MVVGSFAASVYGVSRSTHDMDIVVTLQSRAVNDLARALGEGFYFDEEAARDAVQRSDMFNILHLDSNLKVDFFTLPEDRFNRAQFERRLRIRAWDSDAYVASPEDTVLSKLLWNKIGPSGRQIEDARTVIRAMRDALDYDYLDRWSQELGVEDQLNQLVEET